jgi:glycosyltransferase involved in cell wall biosynthesis
MTTGENLSPQGDPTLSIIIPTLWKHDGFKEYILALATRSFVGEVIIIDNNPEQCATLVAPKIKVLRMSRNIYVNPAWNLGVRHATGKIICLLNDDLEMHDDAFLYAVGLLEADRDHLIGIVGLDWNRQTGELGHACVSWRTSSHFGAAMFIRRSAYEPVPRVLKVWWGDDYLLQHTCLKRRQILQLSGFAAKQQPYSVSISSGRNHIKSVISRDTKLYFCIIRPLLSFTYRALGLFEVIRNRMKILFSLGSLA